MAVSRPRPSPSTASTAMTTTATTTASSSASSTVEKGGDAAAAAAAMEEASKSASAGERHDSKGDEGTDSATCEECGGDDSMEGRPKDDAESAAAATGGAKDDGDAGCPSYASTKSSLEYQQARQDMADGDFEAALGTIESALRETLESVGGDELHESLAPLYYLYGTTLLYSVEESSDVTNAQAQEATMAAAGSGDPSAAIAAQEAVQQQGEINAEDTQIAWENLEMARSILSRSVVISDDVDLSAAGPNSDARDKALDLAQIHLRLGDLQKANGNYADALDDYTTCLDIRSKVFVGGFDRKVADCHYNLGMTYLLRASDGAGGGGGGDGAPAPPPPSAAVAVAAAAAPQQEGQKPALTEAEVAECRANAMRHYLACGRSIGGLVGILCGVEPASIVGDGENEEEKKASATTPQAAAAAASSSAAAALASESDSAKVTAESSATLRDIRSRVSNLSPVDPTSDADTVADLRELLDEIQETIDSSEESVRVLKDVSKMKAEAEAQAEAEDGAALAAGLAASVTATQPQKPQQGPTTTIGFGSSAASAAKTAVTNPPMMVVKKKKKKRKEPAVAVPADLSNAKENPEREGGDDDNGGKRQKKE